MTHVLLWIAAALAEDVHVSSNAKGAAILLNGVDTGLVTPATVNGVPPGQVLVAVEGACSRGEVLLTVRPGPELTRASVLATEEMGTITLQPKPREMEIELDGRPFPGSPGSPVAVSCGSHSLRATLDGYVPAVVTLELAMGQDLVMPLNLQKLGLATLELTVQPRNAELLLDGKAVGTDAVTLPSVYQGPHTIAAELDGHQSAKKQILVEEGEAYAFHFELERSSKKSRNSRVIQISGPKGDAEPAAAAVEPAVEVTPPAPVEATPPAPVEDDGAAEAAKIEATRLAREKEEAEARRRREEAEARADEEEEAARREEEAARREEEAARREEEEVAEAAAAAKARRESEARAEQKRRDEEEARAALDAERKREAARRRANADGSVGKAVGGVGLLAVGAASGVATVLSYGSTAQAYTAYEARVESAENDRLAQKEADAYYEETVVPRRNLMYAAGAGTALFLAGGVTVLLLDEGGPTLAPVPGGGMLGWTVPF